MALDDDDSERQVRRKLDDDDKFQPYWFQEELNNNIRLSIEVNRDLRLEEHFFGVLKLVDTKQFGKALVIKGKMQCAEMDEFIYHECLIHPALLCHSRPKTVFIMGGPDGYAARQVLKHESLEKVVLCDIEEENSDEKFDIIVGDLADPVPGEYHHHLYTKNFYEEILKPKLNEGGIFVTQARPAGILTHKEVFTSIHNTIKQVFKYVKVYTAHVPSFADTWGWVMASDHHPLSVEDGEMDKRIEERIDGELRYVNEAWFNSSTTMNKIVSQSLLNETRVYTDAR